MHNHSKQALAKAYSLLFNNGLDFCACCCKRCLCFLRENKKKKLRVRQQTAKTTQQRAWTGVQLKLHERERVRQMTAKHGISQGETHLCLCLQKGSGFIVLQANKVCANAQPANAICQQITTNNTQYPRGIHLHDCVVAFCEHHLLFCILKVIHLLL